MVPTDVLFDDTMKKRWDKISELYRTDPSAQGVMLTNDKNTALHVAILSYNSSLAESINTEMHIEKMIEHMSIANLKTMNAKGDTPLHLAAAVGWTKICKCMAEKHYELIEERNEMSETPLFAAAHYGKKEAFICLHEIHKKNVGTDEQNYPLCRRKDGNTVLHSALSGESFDLADKIIEFYPNLVGDINLEGESPLHILAKKPTIFKNVTDLGYLDSLISKYALVEFPQVLRKITSRTDEDFGFPNNYRTCVNIFYFFWTPIRGIAQASISRWREDKESQPRREERSKGASIGRQDKKHNANQQDEEMGPKGGERNENNAPRSFPANYSTLILLLKFAINIVLTIVGVGLGKINKIEQQRKKYLHAKKIIEKFLKDDSNYKYVNNGQEPVANELTKLSPQRIEPPTAVPRDTDDPPKSEEKSQQSSTLSKADTPIIIAAKHGIHDMVDIISKNIHVALYDRDSEGRNVLMLAAKHRQLKIFDLLMAKQIPEHVFHHVDDKGNSIIHLAAMLEDRDKPRHISGAALQMQWEMKWFEYVKNSVPPICFTHHINRIGETPEEIFTQRHGSLMQDGYSWLIQTSESCSVIAALMAGAAFATTSSVPGGTNQDTGRPVLQGEVAFDVFSISSLIGLCLAVTSLVFFLAIITSRCVEKDFKHDLPTKLLSGLTCLFVSIVAMLVAYCAGHTFVLRDELQFAEIPIYSVACVPISLYALAQLPLYVDLVRAVCIKKPYHRV